MQEAGQAPVLPLSVLELFNWNWGSGDNESDLVGEGPGILCSWDGSL